MSISPSRVLIAVSVLAIFAGAEPAEAQSSRQQRNTDLNMGARSTQRMMNTRRVEVKPNTMGGYSVRKGSQNLGTVRPDGNGGYRYDESYQQRNPLQTPTIK